MTNWDILKGLDGLEPRFVMAAAPTEGRAPKRSRAWLRWGTVAAGLCVVLALALVLSLLLQPAPGLIANYGSASESLSRTPMPGECIDATAVKEARAHYRGKDVTFLLGMHIYKDEDPEDINEELTEAELAAEYQRLTDLGYRFYRVEDHWTYYGHGQIQYVPVVVGAFTEAGLADFPAGEKYGYYFFFERNGDGSSISVGEDDLITDFASQYAC